MSGGKDGQTLFHRILQATASGLTSTTAVDLHLKVKNKKCDVGLIKKYWITIIMQKISSIFKLIQQISGSNESNDHAHFWPHEQVHMGFWHHAKIQKKKWYSSKKTPGQTEGRMEGRKDGQTLFHRTLPANAGGPKILNKLTTILDISVSTCHWVH